VASLCWCWSLAGLWLAPYPKTVVSVKSPGYRLAAIFALVGFAAGG
jgi:hypothetical protein